MSISQSSITAHPIGYSNRIFQSLFFPWVERFLLKTFLWPFYHPSQESNCKRFLFASPYAGFSKGGFYFQFLYWGGRESQMRGSGGIVPSRWWRCYNWYPVNGLKVYLWYRISIMKIDMPLYLKVLYSTTWQLIYIYIHTLQNFHLNYM